MGKPPFAGMRYARHARQVCDAWSKDAQGHDSAAKAARAHLKSLRTLRARLRQNPLRAGDPVAHDRWPACLWEDYGDDIPTLFRFELAQRWRGYYTLISGEDGVEAWILYLWDHERYDRESGYRGK